MVLCASAFSLYITCDHSGCSEAEIKEVPSLVRWHKSCEPIISSRTLRKSFIIVAASKVQYINKVMYVTVTTV